MSTNAELADEASTLSEMLGGDAVNTKGMNKDALEAVVSELRELVEAAPPGDDSAPAVAAVADVVEGDRDTEPPAPVADAERSDDAQAEANAREAERFAEEAAEYEKRAADEAEQHAADVEAARVAAAERMVVHGARSKIEGGPPVEQPSAPAPRLQQYPYQIAEGRALSCATGIKGPGEEVTLKDLMKGGGGKNADYAQSNLTSLIANGCVVKR